ncbi:oxidoreductase [Sphingobium sp. CR2-8]|uniref:oxidoreductase n=1 Tax=Sphingobium sp. CR2-8 TaxID=1306534 RepID=UPI002DBAC868|nr:oxidoreductase [Sphingobium sp. CR2-8]MEC3909166.1 oxidoreductase [Sphingobium sp. CR2-8]
MPGFERRFSSHRTIKKAHAAMISENKPIAVVTGASSGIGLVAAKALAGAGYRVFGTSRKPSASLSSQIEMVQCDITDDGSVTRAIATILEAAGRIDLLVNNAGAGLAGPAEETSIAQARQLFEVNVFGLIRMVQAVLPVMRAAGSGRIINVSSVLGFMPAPFMAVYSATKHAVEGYTESLDHEIRGFGIRAVLVEPANTKTEFDANMTWAEATLDAYASIRFGVVSMMRGMAETGDSADAVADTILRAAQDRKGTMRFPAGSGRKLGLLRRFVPAKAFDKSLRKQLGVPTVSQT